MPKTTSIEFDKLSTVMVLRNLNKAILKLKKRTKAGLIEAGLMIKAKSSPVTPLKYNNLRNSAYVTWAGADITPTSFSGPPKTIEKLITEHPQVINSVNTGQSSNKEPWVAIGYTAYYAIYVHEMNKNYTIGTWKFLSMTIHENKKSILKLIARRAKIR